MKRVIHGLGALLALVAGLVAVPVALAVLSGHIWPETWSLASSLQALFRPDDGLLLARVLAITGWLAWVLFTVSVVTESVALTRRGRRRLRIPGLAGPQRLAASLLIAVIALLPVASVAKADPSGSPTPSSAPPVSTDRAPTAAPASPEPSTGPPAVGSAAAPGRATSRPPDPRDDHRVHRVETGDDLWSLAERYYGEGTQWRRIAAANRHILSGGPDRLVPGWKLTIPGIPAADPAEPASRTSAGSSPDRRVTVRAGDTLSSIAAELLGREHRWPELYAANRAVLGDPDELPVGVSLRVPAALAGADVATKGTSAPGGKSAPKSTAPPDGAPDPAPPDAATHPAPPPEAASPAPSRSAPTDHAPTPEAPARTREPAATQQPDTKGRSAPLEQPASRPPAASSPAASNPTASNPAASNRASHPAQGPDPAAGSPAGSVPDSGNVVAPTPGLLAGASGLLAAGLVGGLAARRRWQLQARPVGRRILHAPATAASVEVELGARQEPLDLETLDVALRAIAVHCRRTGDPVPQVRLASVDDHRVVLALTGQPGEPPLGFRAEADGWSLGPDDARYLASLPDLPTAMRPYPAVVELGRDAAGRRILADLEHFGLLSLTGDSDRAGRLLAALAVEIAFGPAADELILTLVGDQTGLPAALDKHNVSTCDDLDALLDRLESRARAQQDEYPDGPAGHHRIDPDLSDPWAPEIVLIAEPPGPVQQRRLAALVALEPRPTIAVVTIGSVEQAPWTLELAAEQARLMPVDLVIEPQQLDTEAVTAVVALVAATGSLDTTPAPWWRPDSVPPDPPPDNLTYLARRSAGWAADIDDENGHDMAENPGLGRDLPPDHPVLLLLGPIELVGARGPLPPRAAKQCLEYCGWLLEHPGTTAQAMSSALLVAEGTRRSNMSRLRTWLGGDDEGQAFLPDAYSGRILLHAAVSSDWQRLQILTAAGVNRTSDSGLRAALELVRGAPLADAAPGQWHWAEELRTDMISAVRDIGVELAGRANAAGDLDLARWAAARALAAAPGDELLLSARIRTEHQAGNRNETERLSLQLAAQARALGMDLEPDTVTLLQEVMEGQIRARLA
ncbi:MAG TPA: LysM peptidoglycan-binding domain-containing protein [Microlunatus sp.]|nr:LysM peptidoglycan-binding domain-containing protein [Microlunatus sp.]